jgi:hypothetical protein
MKHLKIFEDDTFDEDDFFSDFTRDIFDLKKGWLVLVRFNDKDYWIAIFASNEYEAMQQLHGHFAQGTRYTETRPMKWKDLGKSIQVYTTDLYLGTVKIKAVVDGLEPLDHSQNKPDIMRADSPELKDWMDERFDNVQTRMKYIKNL